MAVELNVLFGIEIGEVRLNLVVRVLL